MKRILLLLSIALSISTITYGQRGKAKKEEPEEPTPEECIANYEFQKAIDLLEEKIEKLTKRKKSTEAEEALLEIANKGVINLSATEKVTIIDSLLLRKEDLFGILKISSECGEVNANNTEGKILYDSCGTYFLNELKNRLLTGRRGANGKFRLYERTLNGNEWTADKQLKGLESEEAENQNYPFMLTDGVTLYFAADKEEGMGGYDIYMTRYDADEHTYLSPENVGMPFNSSGNDYLMVIDEYYNLGWFVTDRFQAADTVCLYTFLPNETRRVYNEDEVGTEQLISFARINRIQDTWTDRKTVAEAQERLKKLRSGKVQQAKVRDFEFIVNDTHVCYSLDDFKNATAKEKAKLWLETKEQLTKDRNTLDALRMQYATATADKKAQLAPQIRLTESKVEQAERDAKTLEKDIRKAELSKE